METPHNLNDGVLKPRPVLTDVSNLPPKRSFSSISVDDGVDNLAKKKCLSQFGSHNNNNNKDNDSVMLQPEGLNPGFKIPFFGDPNQEVNVSHGASEERNATTCVGFGEKGLERPPNDEGLVDLATESDDRDHYVAENSGQPKCADMAAKPPLYPHPSGSKFLGLERCSGLKSHGGGAANLGVDAATAASLLKNCACSFCTKAGHMWSDLHYQDAKSRLTALRKSQKEARILLQKISGLKDTHTIIHNQQECPDLSNLESTLTHHWQSLFAFTENSFTQEISQRESELQTLRVLKEKCKNDLELTDKSNFEFQQSSDW